MRGCQYSNDELLLYYFGLLKKGKQKKIEKHLKACQQCKKEYKQLARYNTLLQEAIPQSSIPSNVVSILERAKKTKPGLVEVLQNRIHGFIQSIQLNKLRWALPLAIVIAGVLIFSTLFIQKSENYLYLVKSTGNVRINGDPVQDEYIYGCDREVQIFSGKGRCVFQLNKSQVYTLSPDTLLTIRNRDTYDIVLSRGTFFGSVDNAKLKKKVTVRIEDLQFAITGTKFYGSYEDKKIRLTVVSGEVTASVRGEKLALKKGVSLVKEVDKIQLITLSYPDDALSDVNQYHINEHIENMDVVHISSKENPKVYMDHHYMGQTPLLYIKDRDKKQVVTLLKEGYDPHEIFLKAGKDYVSEIKLKKTKKPDVLWKFRIKNKILSYPLRYKNNLIIGDNQGWVYNINILNEQVLWVFKAQDRIYLSPRVYQNIVFVFSVDGFVYAIDLAKGQLLWKKESGILIDSEAVFSGKYIYFGNTKGKLLGYNIYNGQTGIELKFNNGFSTSGVINKDILYIGSTDGILYAIDIRQKKVIWKYQDDQKINSSHPLIMEDKIFFSSLDGYLYSLNVHNGSLLWKFKPEDKQFSSPVRVNKSLVFATSSGIIYCLDRTSGKLKWKFNAHTRDLSKLVVYKNKYILAGDRSNTIYFLTKWGLLIDRLNLNFEEFYLYKNNIISWDQKEIVCHKLYY